MIRNPTIRSLISMHLLISIFITFISNFGVLLVKLVGGFNTQNVKLKIRKKITQAFWDYQ